MLHNWHQGRLQGAELVKHLCKLDRSDIILQANTVATPHFFTDGQAADAPAAPDPGAAAHIPQYWQGQLQQSQDGDAMMSYPVSYPEPDPDDGTWLGEEDASSDDDFDMENFDDDGQPLVNAEGEGLVPMDPAKSFYEEHEAFGIAVFAGNYREVRKDLQATRIGRDQKVVDRHNAKRKGKGKGFNRKPYFKPYSSVKGKAPFKKKDKHTPFTRRAGGTKSRGTVKQLRDKTKCYRCGEHGHISRECKKPWVPKPNGGSEPL